MLRHVAILDDSSEFQQLVQVMIHYLGINQISQWTTGAEAIPALVAAPPDALILDVMMAGMSGLAVWDVLRANPVTAHLPIIVCTAAINRIVEEEARLSGDPHTRILPKPFTLDELRHALALLVPDQVS